MHHLETGLFGVPAHGVFVKDDQVLRQMPLGPAIPEQPSFQAVTVRRLAVDNTARLQHRENFMKQCQRTADMFNNMVHKKDAHGLWGKFFQQISVVRYYRFKTGFLHLTDDFRVYLGAHQLPGSTCGLYQTQPITIAATVIKQCAIVRGCKFSQRTEQ